jgi:hypothetical protein
MHALEEDRKVYDDGTNQAGQTVRQNASGAQENGNFAQLQSRRDQLQNQHAKILDELLSLRERAKETSLVAQATRTPIAQTTIEHWKDGIKDAQGRLEALQREIGEVNKTLRALKAKVSANRWNGNAGKRFRGSNPVGNSVLRDVDIPACDDEENLFLSCFHRIASDSLDPRLLRAIERDAKALAEDFKRMSREGR